MQLFTKIVQAAAMLLLAVPASSGEVGLALTGETAVVLGDDGTPLARASRDYLLEWAGNPDGRVFEIDREKRRIRITPDSAPALWLDCADVAQSTCAAPAAARPASRRSASPDDTPDPAGRTLPICPGDPRCPR